MSDHMHYDFPRRRDIQPPHNFELHGERRIGSGWGGIVAAAAALVLVLSLILIGGATGDSTSEPHPGGAGAPPVAVQQEGAPAADVVAPAR